VAAAASGREVGVVVLNRRPNERCWVRRGQTALGVCWGASGGEGREGSVAGEERQKWEKTRWTKQRDVGGGDSGQLAAGTSLATEGQRLSLGSAPLPGVSGAGPCDSDGERAAEGWPR